MARKKMPWPKDTVTLISKWQRTINGVEMVYRIEHTVLEKSLTGQPKQWYPVSVWRADKDWVTDNDSFPTQPTKEQVEELFDARPGFRKSHGLE